MLDESLLKLQKAPWQTDPFAHLLIADFFPEDFYQDLCDAFQTVQKRGLSAQFSQQQLSAQPHFDCHSLVIAPDSQPPFDFFYSQTWRRAFATRFKRVLSQDVMLQLHHHQPGSASCYVHSDFAKVYFADAPLENQINPWYHQCQYFAQQGVDAPSDRMIRGRAIAVIYYLANPPWQEGDGGQTALYRADDRKNPAKLIAPHSNTLLAFSITPDSFHSFISNLRTERNSLALWFHCSQAESQRLFPNEALRAFSE